jgi:hypothetical protein
MTLFDILNLVADGVLRIIDGITDLAARVVRLFCGGLRSFTRGFMARSRLESPCY